ncbi:MAG: condensation domain-containing protein, partial [Phormidesmis sp.]
MNEINTTDVANLTPEQKRSLLAKLMQRKAPSPSKIPLSFAQQRLWFIQQLQPGQTAYTIPAALRLQGTLQINVLQRCLNEVVARHEILRTQFKPIEGDPIQLVLPRLQ